MTTPANYATLIAEIDVVIESYGLSLQEVFGGRSTQPTLQELIDLRYELFEVDGGGGSSDPSQIVSSTLPTTRVGGAALQNGDRWYNPTTGREGFWNGTLWLGERLELKLGGATNLINGTIHSLGGEPNIFEILDATYIETIEAWFRATVGGTYNELNYWRVSPSIETSRGIGTGQILIPTNTVYQNITAASIVNDMAIVTVSINTYYTTRFYLENFRCWTLSVGSPSAMQWIGGKIIYRKAMS